MEARNTRVLIYCTPSNNANTWICKSSLRVLITLVAQQTFSTTLFIYLFRKHHLLTALTFLIKTLFSLCRTNYSNNDLKLLQSSKVKHEQREHFYCWEYRNIGSILKSLTDNWFSTSIGQQKCEEPSPNCYPGYCWHTLQSDLFFYLIVFLRPKTINMTRKHHYYYFDFSDSKKEI